LALPGEEQASSDIVAAVYGFLNHFGLVRLIAFLRIVNDLRNSRDKLRGIFEAIGSLDDGFNYMAPVRSLYHFTAAI